MDMQCYEKAIELGNMILASEQSLRLADAKAAFEEDSAAQSAYEKYNEYHENMQIARQSGFFSSERYQEALGKLVQMEIDMKKMPAAQEYLKAQEDYDKFANSVLEILRQTIGCAEAKSGGCGGCGHGHRK
ncbi:MAG: YlbF family regulator [Clostridiales bacterium]|jgi:cell fate (sporulation/competence/biofilm development) regulator YlbF (YheA/YmcA/DUF963 family)|nr:YlbF family regulator [Clostridiales bacterium]